MNNLFVLFDPQSIGGGPWLWAAIFTRALVLPNPFWATLSIKNLGWRTALKSLSTQLTESLTPLSHPGLTHWATRVFIFLGTINLGGLLPYVFTPSSHLRFSLSLRLYFWLSYFLYSLARAPTFNLAHLIPSGTPGVLQPFMVFVETVSSLIRPLTLAVRLAANIVAGHLLIALAREASNLALVGVGVGALAVLETLVAVVQAYVFTLLGVLYLAERNSPRVDF